MYSRFSVRAFLGNNSKVQRKRPIDDLNATNLVGRAESSESILECSCHLEFLATLLNLTLLDELIDFLLYLVFGALFSSGCEEFRLLFAEHQAKNLQHV